MCLSLFSPRQEALWGQLKLLFYSQDSHQRGLAQRNGPEKGNSVLLVGLLFLIQDRVRMTNTEKVRSLADLEKVIANK